MPETLQTIVQRMVDAGESEENIASVIQHYKGAQPAAAPSQFPGLGAALQNAVRIIKEHPVQTGATVGGLAAGALTGGLGLIPAAALSALGSAGGAGYGIAARQLATGKPEPVAESAKTMAEQGALGAAGEVGGRAIGAGLQALGRGAYRTALAPTQAVLKKYGSELVDETPVPRVVAEGLQTKTPVSLAGLKQATATKAARMGEKATALKAADPNVGYSADLIARDASQPLSEYATKQVRAGLPNPTAKMGERLGQFRAANPNGTLTPSTLEDIKSTLDDVSGEAYQKIRGRMPITPREKTTIEMGSAMGRAQEAAVPGYKDMNRGIMTAEGLRQAIERRTLGSGGNQVLDTLLALIHPSPGSMAGRVAMMPPVLSKIGIGANTLGTAGQPVLTPALKAALLAAFGQDQNQP